MLKFTVCHPLDVDAELHEKIYPDTALLAPLS